MESPQWKIGDRIENRYEIHQILKGGMGVVYICFDRENRHPFALKTFKDRYLNSQSIRDRFIREAKIWIELGKHRNIVRAHWVQNFEGKPYIVLEYIANSEMRCADLGEWITQGIGFHQVLKFAVQFCDGMDYAHKKVGMVHRDIKPQNVLVTQDKVLKITDFGLVKTIAAEVAGENLPETVSKEKVSDRVSLTRTGRAMGTPSYMSPEQWRNARNVDIRSDIYAFGTVLYEMLTGRYVFEARPTKECMRSHLYEEPPSPLVWVPDLPRNIESIVLKCLAKDPEQRFQDFAVLRKELAGMYRELTGKDIAPPVKEEALEGWEMANKGASLYDLGYTDEALACYDHALNLDPGNIEIQNNKGTTLAKMGRYEEALTCYDDVLSIDPDNSDALVNKGNFLYDLGHYKEALDCCEKALSLDPKAVDAWTDKGACLNSLGRYEEAFACHEQALLLEPKNANALLNKGNSAYFLERYEEALTYYENALIVDSTYLDACLSKGNALQKLGRYKEAITCADHVLSINSEHFGAWFNKGCIFLELRQSEEALICYERMLDIEPENANAWFQKGISLAMARRFQEALPCFTKALEIDPHFEKARQVIARCEQDLNKSMKQIEKRGFLTVFQKLSSRIKDMSKR